MARITEERLNELNCSTITDREVRKLVKAYRKRWIEWGGGKSPEGLDLDTEVEVRFRGGTRIKGNSVRAWRGLSPSSNNWLHYKNDDDIIAYRVVE